MRRCYLVCYDIRNPKRLHRVFKALKGYGEHWQFSIFFCVLKDIDRVRMESDLKAEMNLKEDQALILDLGGDEKGARGAAAIIGQPLPQAASGVVVI
jgi:CRISPR-associated protein Cas2